MPFSGQKTEFPNLATPAYTAATNLPAGQVFRIRAIGPSSVNAQIDILWSTDGVPANEVSILPAPITISGTGSAEFITQPCSKAGFFRVRVISISGTQARVFPEAYRHGIDFPIINFQQLRPEYNFLLQRGESLTLGRQHTQVLAPNDTVENALFTLALPPNTMGANDTIRVSAIFSFGAGSANSKVLRCKLGTMELFGNQDVNQATTLGLRRFVRVSARNSQTAQIADGGVVDFGADTVGPVVGSNNMAAAQTLTITVQKANASDVVALESVLVELLTSN